MKQRFLKTPSLVLVVICALVLMAGRPTNSLAAAGSERFFPAVSGGMAYQLIYWDYTERVEGAQLMELEGFFHGMAGWITVHTLSPAFMFRFELEGSYGSLDYDGQTMDGTPVQTDSDDILAGGRLLFGKDIILTRSAALTPYLGIAGRYWRNNLVGPGSYLREIFYIYSPAGLTISFKPNRWWLHIFGEYDLFWLGRVKSHLSDIDPTLPDITNDQNILSGYGLRFAVSLSYDFGRVAFGIEPFIRYWKVNKSDVETVFLLDNWYPFYEPENKTLMGGLRISLAF